tara:strand:- start:134 stop:970 length:837 start_codon:yes stop_codon:yes gene_type:complete
MILDALSRAEKERQSENAVGLDTARYATSSTIKEDRFKRWVLIALVANFLLIILLSLAYAWKTFSQDQSIPVSNTDNMHTQSAQSVVQQQMNTAPVAAVADELLENQADKQSELTSSAINLSNLSNKTVPVNSLSDEAKVRENEVIKTPSKKPVKSIVKKTPPVQYSSKPLSAPVQTSKPTVASIAAAVERQRVADASSSQYARLNDIPVHERSQLDQYQVNVHVYDDSGQGSFVLINMVKYKQGDYLPGGSAFVSAIVPEGVVIDYGNGKALIERNQ